MMGRKRKANKSLPPRVYVHHGSYRYVPVSGPKVTLARVGDYAGMLRKLADVLGEVPAGETMAQIFDRYMIDVLPKKAPSTQREQTRQLTTLKKVFGRMRPDTLRTHHAAQYRDARARKAPTAANRELELLSHVCTKAREWGYMRDNPLFRLEKTKQKPRRRYVTDDEYLTVRELASPMVQCVMDLALLTGLRRGDVLSLTRASVTEEGLRVRPSKTEDSTGQELVFKWTPALAGVVRQALSLKPQVRTHIVCNRKAKPFTKNGFDSVWNRLMAKAEATGMERWQFKDLRRKSASDEADGAAASEKLGHAGREITERVYRVLPRKVTPLR